VLALSLANLVAGTFGGIPGTAALARTALNVRRFFFFVPEEVL
jgi:MFS superfamily sulfate permease-like transporter